MTFGTLKYLKGLPPDSFDQHLSRFEQRLSEREEPQEQFSPENKYNLTARCLALRQKLLSTYQGAILGAKSLMNECYICDAPKPTLFCDRCHYFLTCSEACKEQGEAVHQLWCVNVESGRKAYFKPDPEYGLPPVLHAAVFNALHTMAPRAQKLHATRFNIRIGAVSADDIAKIRTLPDSIDPPLLYEDEDGSQEAFTQELCREKFQMAFKWKPFLRTDALLNHLKTKPQYQNNKYGQLSGKKDTDHELLRAFQNAPPSLVIFKKMNGYGVRTTTAISKGQVICPLGSDALSRSAASNLRSPGIEGFLTDGPPNCMPVKVCHDPLQVEAPVVLRALCDLAPGDELFILLALQHMFRKMSYPSLSAPMLNALNLYASNKKRKTSQINDTLDFLERGSKRNFNSIDFFRHSQMLAYILATNKVFFTLHLNRTLQVENTLKLLQHTYICNFFKNLKTITPLRHLINSLESMRHFSNDHALFDSILNLSDTLFEPGFIFLFTTLRQDYPLSCKSLPHYLKRTYITQHLMTTFLTGIFQNDSDDFDDDTMKEIGSLLATYKALPKELKDDTIPNFIESRKIDADDEQTEKLEMIKKSFEAYSTSI
jgi:hypothetical protein